MSKNILISGGAGYLGTKLTQYLLKKGYVVTVYDELYFPWLFKNKKKLKNSKNLNFLKKNITEVSTQDFKGIDIVCDLNGIPNDPASEINKKYTWKINHIGRRNFALKAKKSGVKRYIFNSTCSVYGFNKNIVHENSKKNPLSTYARANLKSEQYVYKLKDKNFKVNILRNSTLFGFSNNLRLDLVINVFVYNIIKNRKIKIDGDGLQYRPFISLNDVCKIYDILIKSKKKSFITNLVNFNLTIKDLTKKICKVLNVSFDSQVIFNKKNNDKRNYNVKSKNFKKLFKNFMYSSFKKEIRDLKAGIIKNDLKINSLTIRMKFYKKLF
jgi:nucleoside-diphosphate-sugar epimerase